MKMYADSPARRTRQIVADLLVVLWLVFWVWAGWWVHEGVQELARPAERTQSAATGLATSLRDTGDSLGGIPLIGDTAARPLDEAAGHAEDLAESSARGVDTINSLALKLGLGVAIAPMLIAFAIYLPARVTFIRNATAGQQFVDSTHDLDLFAMRALANQPLHLLARISPDPAGGWRARDPWVVAQLAALEMRDVGLRPPPWL
ncbi:MAG: hypothetical protein ABWX84_04740, partial [Nocardioides sp.]